MGVRVLAYTICGTGPGRQLRVSAEPDRGHALLRVHRAFRRGWLLLTS